MSKKRKSAESNNDLAVFQRDDNAKRAKLASLSGTKLQDLPIELLQCILVKVVAMEVSGLKLAKSVWKEKSGPVISRLRSVCSQWSNILATNFFRIAVHTTLDRMAQETIRLDILYRSPIQLYVLKVTTLKDEIFMLSREDDIIVCERNNMAAVKDVIPLPGIITIDIAACVVSKCVYVLGLPESNRLSVSRIRKGRKHPFRISPWISDLRRSYSNVLSVSSNGNLIILLDKEGANPAEVYIYNAKGSLQHTIMLSSGIYDFRHGVNVLQKSNGNLVLVSHNAKSKTRLTEIAMSGSIVRQYQSKLGKRSAVDFADIYGRIVISEASNRMELLDSELNLLNFTGAQLNGGQLSDLHMLHYNSEKNEVVGIHAQNSDSSVLTIFRLTEE